MKIVHDDAAGSEPRTAKANAMEFLRAALVGAPVPAAELSRVAHEHGLTPKAIRSAREALGVKIEPLWQPSLDLARRGPRRRRFRARAARYCPKRER